MPNDNEDILAQLKEMVDSFKGVSGYAKDLSSAIAASAQPLQRANDMTKAIQEQMETVAKNSKEMVESVKQMAEGTSATINKIRELTQANVEAKKSLTESREEVVKQQLETEKLRTQKLQVAADERDAQIRLRDDQSRAHKAVEATHGVWQKTVDTVKDMHVAIAKAGYETDKFGVSTKKAGFGGFMARATASGLSTGSSVLTGQADPASALKSIGSAVAGLGQTAGIGGILGMMIYGKIKDAEFNAVGQSAGQMFDQVGGHTQKFVSHMAGAARTLSVYAMASKEDLTQVAAAFAGTGVSAATAASKIEGFRSVVGGDLIIAALAADKALELPTGTFAKLSGVMAKDFNTTADKAFINLMNLASGAKEAGMSASTFLQQTMEISSGLRLMNANAGAAGVTMLGLSKTMMGRGMGAAYSQQYAGAGMANAGGAIGGMGEGLSAIIGERLGFSSGLDALYAMKTGSGMSSRGTEQLDMTAIMKEMRNIVMNDMGLEGQSRGTQAFAVQKMFGTDTAGADAILDAMDEATTTNKLGTKSLQDLNTAFNNESKKTNQIHKWIEVIKDAISNVMVGLLGMIVNGIKMLLNGIMLLGANLMSSILNNPDSDSRKVYEAAADKYRVNIQSGINNGDASGMRISRGIGQLPDAFEGLGSEMGLVGGWPWSKTDEKKPRTRAEQAEAEAEYDEWKRTHDKNGALIKQTVIAGGRRLRATIKLEEEGRDNGAKNMDSGAR